jgi:hypothetical protein
MNSTWSTLGPSPLRARSIASRAASQTSKKSWPSTPREGIP